MTRKLSRLAFAAAALLALPAAAQIYKWTDSAGKTHYGDKPPEDVAKRELKISAESFVGTPQVRDWGSVLRRPASAAPATSTLTMYSATWCGPCKSAKAYMAAKGIAYRDIDIDASEANGKEYLSQGGGGVPLFVSGDKRMNGFSPAALEDLIAKPGR
jgi:glutaredoxin